MLQRGLKDPRVGLVTVTGVDLSGDLRHAKVFVSVMGSQRDKEQSLEALNHAAGWVRRELGQRIRLKPDLHPLTQLPQVQPTGVIFIR